MGQRNGLTFDRWMDEVSQEMKRSLALDYCDLSKVYYWNMWNEEISPSDAVDVMLRETRLCAYDLED